MQEGVIRIKTSGIYSITAQLHDMDSGTKKWIRTNILKNDDIVARRLKLLSEKH